MAIGLIGKKSGMTRVFSDSGDTVPVTVIEVEPNRITQVKTDNSDGYSAIQVTTGSVKQNAVSKPKAGHFAKSNISAGRGLWEFRLDGDEEQAQLGDEIGVEQFEVGQRVDIQGISER